MGRLSVATGGYLGTGRATRQVVSWARLWRHGKHGASTSMVTAQGVPTAPVSARPTGVACSAGNAHDDAARHDALATCRRGHVDRAGCQQGASVAPARPRQRWHAQRQQLCELELAGVALVQHARDHRLVVVRRERVGVERPRAANHRKPPQSSFHKDGGRGLGFGFGCVCLAPAPRQGPTARGAQVMASTLNSRMSATCHRRRGRGGGALARR